MLRMQNFDQSPYPDWRTWVWSKFAAKMYFLMFRVEISLESRKFRRGSNGPAFLQLVKRLVRSFNCFLQVEDDAPNSAPPISVRTKPICFLMYLKILGDWNLTSNFQVGQTKTKLASWMIRLQKYNLTGLTLLGVTVNEDESDEPKCMRGKSKQYTVKSSGIGRAIEFLRKRWKSVTETDVENVESTIREVVVVIREPQWQKLQSTESTIDQKFWILLVFKFL